ncbi:MAG: hypothetical protein S4CHLAM45_10050 [Chlamydiales bacterium]|nr:hypothetical protein [Chlamydiales bacterium]MCH9620179.1 hypothetical protein [Chlamydiales bacterium]MCH9623106.1 hypothetical protein [Chlamydiales bacterium]
MLDLINQALETVIPKGALLKEPALYSLLSNGKRIRPLLVLTTVEMLQAPIEKALKPACALELIHTYSLIHDDLPCMDDDDYRRGKKTLHRAYDEATAVLTGDYLLTYAFELLSQATDLKSEQRLKLIQILSKRAGIFGMVGGQVLDIQESKEVDLLHSLKTAALFQAALEFAEVIGEVDDPKLSEFGHSFGMLFQAADDLDDKDHPLGEEHAKKSAAKALEQCEGILAQLNYNTAPLKSYLEMYLGLALL